MKRAPLSPEQILRRLRAADDSLYDVIVNHVRWCDCPLCQAWLGVRRAYRAIKEPGYERLDHLYPQNMEATP